MARSVPTKKVATGIWFCGLLMSAAACQGAAASSEPKMLELKGDLRVHDPVIMREGNRISLFNYENSKEIFEEFKFTGLNNFDFYASEFFRSGFADEASGEDPGEGPEKDPDEGPENNPEDKAGAWE